MSGSPPQNHQGTRELCEYFDMFFCPNPDCDDGEDSDPEEGDGHTIDDYYCKCEKCGAEWSVHREYGGWFKYY